MKSLISLREALDMNAETLLQCIIPGFSLKKYNQKVKMVLQFDDSTLCILDQGSRSRWIREAFADRGIFLRKIKDQINRFFYSQETNDSSVQYQDVPLRYLSGGVLPVVRIGQREYFAFFYRDIFPGGWNIANGASMSLEDMKNPEKIIHREFLEELLIFNLKRSVPVSLDVKHDLHLPEMEHAWKEWKKILKFSNDSYKKKKDVNWVKGPHDIEIIHGKNPGILKKNFFISITLEDLSIELDHLACFELQENEVLLDGEILDGCLINRIIGLFEIQGFLNCLEKQRSAYIPDLCFYSGRKYSNKEFPALLELYHKNNRWKHDKASRVLITLEKSSASGPCLCPITQSLVQHIMENQIKW